ncbi:MAG: outer membrane protein transport protein [Bacteroidia bacterium]
MKNILLSSLFLISALSVEAGGFQVNLQGQKQIGMGHTGTGLLLDGACILFNPGALCFMDTNAVNVSGNFIFPRTEYLAPSPDTYNVGTTPGVDTPFNLYANFKFKKTAKWNVGLGVYTPFGSRVEYPSNWKGEFLLQNIDLKTIFIQPTFSYQLTPQLGIGLGAVIGIGSFQLQRAIPVQNTNGTYGEANLKGSANGYGFNAGIYYKPTEKFSVGLDFRSDVPVNITNGTANFTVPASLSSYFPTTTFTSKIVMPFEASIGFGYVVNPKLKLAFDVNYVGWNSYDTLAFTFKTTTAQLQNIHSPRDYKNAFIFRVGAQYQLSEKIILRAGVYYDLSPVPNGYLTPETPDANKIGLSAGMTWKASKKINVDLSFLYDDVATRTDTNIETQFSGTYKTKAIIPGIGVEYVF